MSCATTHLLLHLDSHILTACFVGADGFSRGVIVAELAFVRESARLVLVLDARQAFEVVVGVKRLRPAAARALGQVAAPIIAAPIIRERRSLCRRAVHAGRKRGQLVQRVWHARGRRRICALHPHGARAVAHRVENKGVLIHRIQRAQRTRNGCWSPLLSRPLSLVIFYSQYPLSKLDSHITFPFSKSNEY